MNSPERRERAHSILAALLLLVAAAAMAVRITSIVEPLGIDQSLWASAARGLERGQLLYRDVWEQRPPGIYWIYLWGFRLFGWKESTVAWLDILAATTTAVLLFAIVRALASGLTAALCAALFVVLTMPAWMYSYDGFLERSVCETFIITCVAGAALAATRLRERPRALPAVALGLCCGAAVVLKPNAGAYFPALLLWVAVYRAPAVSTGALFRSGVVACVAAAVLPIVALAWLWRLGILHDARVAVVDFNRFYLGLGFTPSVYAGLFAKAVMYRLKNEPLWLAGAAGSLLALWYAVRHRSIPALPGLFIIWGAAATSVVIVNGVRLYASYFLNPLPPLAIAAAWLLADAWRKEWIGKVTATLAALAMAYLLIKRGYVTRVSDWAGAGLAQLRGQSDRTTYLERFGGYANNRGYSARANAELADYIRSQTSPDDRVFLFGINGAGVYFLADRLTAQRLIRVNFFVPAAFPEPGFNVPAVLADLERTRPRYVIFEKLNARPPLSEESDALEWDPAVRQLLSGYHLDRRIEDFALYRRAD
jgi:4-amino-4-deoxy-L-arabinose transferase-like glycosyltransferase